MVLLLLCINEFHQPLLPGYSPLAYSNSGKTRCLFYLPNGTSHTHITHTYLAYTQDTHIFDIAHRSQAQELCAP